MELSWLNDDKQASRPVKKGELAQTKFWCRGCNKVVILPETEVKNGKERYRYENIFERKICPAARLEIAKLGLTFEGASPPISQLTGTNIDAISGRGNIQTSASDVTIAGQRSSGSIEQLQIEKIIQAHALETWTSHMGGLAREKYIQNKRENMEPKKESTYYLSYKGCYPASRNETFEDFRFNIKFEKGIVYHVSRELFERYSHFLGFESHLPGLVSKADETYKDAKLVRR